MNPIIEHCLTTAPLAPETRSVGQWWQSHRAASASWERPIEQAIAGGFVADRVGWAFASGYQAALRALVPGLAPDTVSAFCVTEESGNRPRDIRTTITHTPGGWRVDGAKRWTTLGPGSGVLLVAGTLAGDGEGDGARPSIRVIRVPTDTAGVTTEVMPQTRFVPEVPHARVQLQGVLLPDDALLAGDGYDGYVKPFRTIEDAHVTAAVLAYLLREARARAWPAEFRERVTAVLATFCAVAAGSPRAPATHVALAGTLHWAHRLYEESAALWLAAGDDPASLRWQRDAALFGVAAGARTQRAARAWEQLDVSPAAPRWRDTPPGGLSRPRPSA